MTTINDATDQTSILESLTKQYKAAAKKSCGGTIEMGETIVHADQELTGPSHTAFYEAIGIDPNSSKTRKFKKIGETSTRFKLCLERLPNAWTTLYQLSKLEVGEFEMLMASDALHPLATWRELEGVLGREPEDTADPDPHRIRLHIHFDLSDVPVHRQREFVDRLNELCADFGASCEPSKASQATIDSLPNADADVPNGTNDNHELQHEAV